MIHLFIYGQDILENTLTDFLTLFERNSNEVKIWISSHLVADMEISDALLAQKIDDISSWDKKTYQQKDSNYWKVTNNSQSPFNLLVNSCLAEILERVNHEYFSNNHFFLVRLVSGNEKEYLIKTTNNPPNNTIFCTINCIQFNSLIDILVKLAPYSTMTSSEMAIRLFFFHDGKTGNCFIGNIIPKKDIR